APRFGVMSSHAPPSATLALQVSAPAAVLETVRLSTRIAALAAAAVSSTCTGVTESAATLGGLLVSLSIWQVASRTVSAHPPAPIAHRLVTGLLRALWMPCDGSTKMWLDQLRRRQT